MYFFWRSCICNCQATDIQNSKHSVVKRKVSWMPHATGDAKKEIKNTVLNLCLASITYKYPSSVSSRQIHANNSHRRRLLLISSSFVRLYERIKLNFPTFLRRYWLEWKLRPFNFVFDIYFLMFFIVNPSKHSKELQVYKPYFSQRMSAMTIQS
jgi:hypothetical protein